MKTPTGFRSSTPCTWSSGVWPVTLLFPPRLKKAFHEAILATEQWARGETCRDLMEDRDWLKSTAPPFVR